jgi:putative transposase
MGFPALLWMDNGPELTCRALAKWAEGIMDLAFIPPGEPWKNGYVKSFHSRQRDEFLNINTFPSLLHARVELTDWHHEYNSIRRHLSLGYLAPIQ